MGQAKLIEVPDDAALRAVELLLKGHSKQGEAGIVNLLFTGNRLQDLLELERLTAQPHYGIHGLLNEDLDAKDEIIHLLAAGHTQVSLSLYYPWGFLPLFFRSAARSEKGFLSIEVEPPAPGWLLQEVLAGLMPIPEETGEVVVTSSGGREGIHLTFLPEQAARVEELLRALVGRLDAPMKAHVILNGDLKTVRELYDSGRVIPCKGCCAWHFEYMDLMATESDVDPSRLDEVAAFLIRRLGRDRALTFRGFAWKWENGSAPSLANAVGWSIPKRGPGSIEMRWYDEEPPSRGTRGSLKKELGEFLARVSRP